MCLPGPSSFDGINSICDYHIPIGSQLPKTLPPNPTTWRIRFPRCEETHIQSRAVLNPFKLKTSFLEAHGLKHDKLLKFFTPHLFLMVPNSKVVCLRFHTHKPRTSLAQPFPSALPLCGHPPLSQSLLPRLCSPQRLAFGISWRLHLGNSPVLP